MSRKTERRLDMLPALKSKCQAAGMPDSFDGEKAQLWLAYFFDFIFSGTPLPRKFTPTLVEKERQCPLCYEGYGGIGRQYNTTRKGGLKIRYYKCPECANTWSVAVREIVEYLRCQAITAMDDDKQPSASLATDLLSDAPQQSTSD